MFKKKREEEDLPALKTALTHRYNDLKIMYKNTIEDSLHPSETTDNTMDNRMTITRKQKWERKMGDLND